MEPRQVPATNQLVCRRLAINSSLCNGSLCLPLVEQKAPQQQTACLPIHNTQPALPGMHRSMATPLHIGQLLSCCSLCQCPNLTCALPTAPARHCQTQPDSLHTTAPAGRLLVRRFCSRKVFSTGKRQQERTAPCANHHPTTPPRAGHPSNPTLPTQSNPTQHNTHHTIQQHRE